jgi:hypothetical protein
VELEAQAAVPPTLEAQRVPNAVAAQRDMSHFLATKKGVAKKETAAVWAVVLRLSSAHPQYSHGYTHGCTLELDDGSLCQEMFTLHERATKRQGPSSDMYSSTQPKRHCDRMHGTHPKWKVNVERKVSEAAAALVKDPAPGPSSLKERSAAGAGKKMTQATLLMPMSGISKEQQAANMMRWVVYSKGAPSLSAPTDPYFKTMLLGLNANATFCYGDNLKTHILAELHMFVLAVKYLLGEGIADNRGNPFGQVGHDGVTLGDQLQYQSFSLSFLARDWRKWTLCLAFFRAPSHKALVLGPIFKDNFKQRYGYDLDGVANSSRQDQAAGAVAGEMGFDKEHCGMHVDDKVGQWAIGSLTKSRNKQEVESFPAGVAVTESMRKLAKEFAKSGARRAALRACSKRVEGPDIIPEVDKCGTRVASTHGMFYKNLRLFNSLNAYVSAGQLHKDHKEAQRYTVLQVPLQQWKAAAEMEAVLEIVRQVTTYSQSEREGTGAYDLVLTFHLLNSLKAGKPLQVVQLGQPEVRSKPVRRAVPDNELTATGMECKARALAEAQRRHSESSFTDSQLLALVLDFRTKNLSLLSENLKQRAELVARNSYVQYSLAADKYEASLRAASAATAGLESGAEPATKKVKIEPGLQPVEEEDDDMGFTLPGEDLSDGEEALAQLSSVEFYEANFNNEYRRWKHLKVDFTKPPFNMEELPKSYMSMIDLPVGEYYRDTLVKQKELGIIPAMARLTLGKNRASSFNERINSVAKDVMDPTRTDLGAAMQEALTLLRVNKEFMEYVRLRKEQDPEFKAFLAAGCQPGGSSSATAANVEETDPVLQLFGMLHELFDNFD